MLSWPIKTCPSDKYAVYGCFPKAVNVLNHLIAKSEQQCNVDWSHNLLSKHFYFVFSVSASSPHIFLSPSNKNTAYINHYFSRFGNRPTNALRIWRPLNYSSQTHNWLLIHPFFWKENLIIILTSARPVRSHHTKQRTSAPRLHRLVRLGVPTDDSLRMTLETAETSDELCKLSVNIVTQMGPVSHMLTSFFPAMEIYWNAVVHGHQRMYKFISFNSSPPYQTGLCRQRVLRVVLEAEGDKGRGGDWVWLDEIFVWKEGQDNIRSSWNMAALLGKAN